MGAILMKPMDVEVLKEQRTGQVQFSDKQWTIVCRLLDLSEREEFVCRLLCDGHNRQNNGRYNADRASPHGTHSSQTRRAKSSRRGVAIDPSPRHDRCPCESVGFRS
jgi:hypothetical protein